MVVVIKKKGESKDSMIKRLTRDFIDEKIQDKVREGQYYNRPSQVNKIKAIERAKKRRTRVRSTK